jgi:hypothetical protein
MISANRTIQTPRHFIFSKVIGDKNYGITIFPGHSYHVLVVPNKCPESTLLGIMDKNHYKISCSNNGNLSYIREDPPPKSKKSDKSQ